MTQAGSPFLKEMYLGRETRSAFRHRSTVHSKAYEETFLGLLLLVYFLWWQRPPQTLKLIYEVDKEALIKSILGNISSQILRMRLDVVFLFIISFDKIEVLI